MTTSDLEKLTPQFNWTEYFARLPTPAFSKLNVSEPDFFKTLNALLTKTSLPELRDYVLWHYLHASAALLSKSFVDENFNFYSATLTGVKAQKPRWKRCVAAADDELGDALGRAFVEKTFGQQGKERTLEMVKALESAMAVDIQSISWMSAETKKQAMVKLHAIINKIGYPEKWRDYSSVEIKADDYFGNWYRANQYETKRERDKIARPTDKMEWDFTTPTVNAGYDPLQNTINFPAGILQPPFFSTRASDAANFGAIGMVIGHELTHGFDDEGRQFDADGNLRDWWQKEDEEKFNKRASCLADQASQFEAVPGSKVNGKLTLGENTADNGGTRIAYMALLDTLEKRHVSFTERTDGFTPAQQFFLGEAQAWCENIRPERAIMLVQVDPHPPAEFRVNGVLSNMQEFQQAFSCKPGDKMYRANACLVW
jgi:endothelin-converting enzyme/putative endopeptidase